MNIRKKSILFILLILGMALPVLSQNLKSGEPIEDIQKFCSNQKGFNLLGKFDKNWSSAGFKEKQFQIIQDLGFNFVRLPVDYRTYTLSNNWNYFVESWVKNIDDAVTWGQEYGVHVCLNLHRAPGYCVNTTGNLPANQQLDLWTDTVAQNVFVNHWQYFADRFKDISPKYLSFNLVNEPNSDVSEQQYLNVMKKAINVIHEISPNRLVFVDALNYSNKIIVSLKDEPNVAQAIHSYSPFRLTHYKANWVNGSDTWAEPKWPVLAINNYLYGSWKSEFRSPLVLNGNFATGTKIVVNVNQVSIESTLQIKSNNQTIYSKRFVCSANPGDDFTEVVNTEWGFQNISNKDFSVELKSSSSKLSFENINGDWMTINSISTINNTDTITYFLGNNNWGEKQKTYAISENGEIRTEDGENLLPFQEYKDNIKLAKENGIPFMVQEFGVHNQTPHPTTISFLSDLMDFFNENNIGWALWNLDGSFGILNSGRNDCNYESFNGYQLDRQMLNVLQKMPTFSKTVKFDETLNVYPNPAHNKLFLKGDIIDENTEILVYNILGTIVKEIEEKMDNSEILEIDVADLKPGIYFISFQNKGQKITEKVIIN